MIVSGKQLSTEVCQFVENDEAVDIIKKLELELAHSSIPGIGLAAPQIGINKAVAIVRILNPFDSTDHHIINLINPKIIDAYDIIQFNEGCLSFPGQSEHTIRYNHITIETNDDYEYYAERINAKRYGRDVQDVPIVSNKRRMLEFGEIESDDPNVRRLQQLLCVCVQHEMSHLLGLTMMDFAPKEIGRNDRCPVHHDAKNKKCCNYKFYNNNLSKLFNPQYKR